MKKSKFSVRVLTEIAIFAAIGFALDILQGGMFKGLFANGGSIGIAMVPVFIIAYRRGLLPGIACGFLLSLVQMLGGVYVISGKTGALAVLAPFAQVLLDYVLAYTVVGFAGAWSGSYKNASSTKGKLVAIIIGCVVGGLAKYLCHVLSGGLFWLDPGITFLGINGGSWWYTIVYNGCYCIPNVIICAAVMVAIAKIYPQFLDADYEAVDQISEEIKENDVEESSDAEVQE